MLGRSLKRNNNTEKEQLAKNTNQPLNHNEQQINHNDRQPRFFGRRTTYTEQQPKPIEQQPIHSIQQPNKPEQNLNSAEQKALTELNSKKHSKGELFEGVKLFHGPIQFKFFRKKLIVTTGKQIGFAACFIAIIVLLVSMLAIIGDLKTSINNKAYYSNQITALETSASKNLDIIKNALDSNPEITDYNTTTGKFDETCTEPQIENEISGYITNSNGSITIIYYIEISEKKHFGQTIKTYRELPETLNIAYHIISEDEVEFVEVEFQGVYESKISNYQNKLQLSKDSFKIAVCSTVIISIFVVLSLVILVFMIINLFKISKILVALKEERIAKEETEEAKEMKDSKETKEKQVSLKPEQAQEVKTRQIFCEYCGARFSDNEPQSPACGSSHFVSKR